MSSRPLYLIPLFVLSAMVIGCSDDDHDYHHHDHDRVVYREHDDHRGPDKVIVREEPAGYRYDHDHDYDHH